VRGGDNREAGLILTEFGLVLAMAVVVFVIVISVLNIS
jgi:hypothetical protein